MTGPLFQLQVLGSICPCLLSSEQRNVLQAVRFINRTCRRVQWQPPSSSKSTSMFGSWFQNNKSDDTSDEAAGPCRAVLVVRDNANGKPTLCIEPIVGTSSTTGRGCTNIRLRKVDTVMLTDDGLTWYGKKDNGQAPELMRFIPLQYDVVEDDDATGTAVAAPVTSDVRNLLLHHCLVLVEWERQRTQELVDDDDDDEEDPENQPNFLQARAQQAKHFATRELELQRTRKQREKRKAALVAETGGMKYTAIAMAKSQS